MNELLHENNGDGPSDNLWTAGSWVEPVSGREYFVPDNVANHKKFAGLTAYCRETRSNHFGMHWAYLVATNKDGETVEGWVRTNHIQELPDPRYNGGGNRERI